MRSESLDGVKDLSDEDLEVQLEFYNHTHAAPTYHGYTDLVVANADGTHVAGCEAAMRLYGSLGANETIRGHRYSTTGIR